MKNLKLGVRLGLGFGLMMLILAIVTVIGIARLGDQNRTTAQISTNLYPKSNASQELAYAAVDSSRIVRNLILLTDEKAIASNRAGLDKNRALAEEKMAVLEKLVDTDDARVLLTKLKADRAAFYAFTDKVVAQAVQGQKAEAQATLYGPEYQTQVSYLATLADMVKLQDVNIRAGGNRAQEVYQQSTLILSITAVIGALLGLVGAFLITRSVTGPLRDAVQAADRVASGDLSRPITSDAKDETGQLLQALARMQQSLGQTVSLVRSNAVSVASASVQIEQGNTDLSQRTEEQASALQQTAASMEELSSTVRQNADNALQANQLAQSASTVAVRGGEVVGHVVETMKGINDSSKRIADIISVIDSIAFQTNILALNAAVEAARAGDQGRGFAVVASEVRSLAQRSAEAAKEIKSLITASVEQVDAGSTLVDQAGTTMSEVVQSIRRVTDIMGEISAASTEQSQGVAQVGEAITQMDQVTQQNAALVEESAAAAGSLKQQADQLVQAVAVFQLGASEGGNLGGYTPPPARAPAPPAPARRPPAVAARPAAAKAPALAVVKPAAASKAPAPAARGNSSEADWESF